MVIEPDIKHTFIVERSFHISKAVIDFSSLGVSDVITSLVVDCDDQKGIILCNLMGYESYDSGYQRRYSKKDEADLDVYFRAGQHITFHSEKPHSNMFPYNLASKQPLSRIHLSGYEFGV